MASSRHYSISWRLGIALSTRSRKQYFLVYFEHGVDPISLLALLRPAKSFLEEGGYQFIFSNAKEGRQFTSDKLNAQNEPFTTRRKAAAPLRRFPGPTQAPRARSAGPPPGAALPRSAPGHHRVRLGRAPGAVPARDTPGLGAASASPEARKAARPPRPRGNAEQRRCQEAARATPRAPPPSTRARSPPRRARHPPCSLPAPERALRRGAGHQVGPGEAPL